MLKESQGYRNHVGDLFAIFVEFYDRETQFHFVQQEIYDEEVSQHV